MAKQGSNGKIENARIDKLVAQYVAIRDRLDQLKEEYKKVSEPFEDAKQQLISRMLAFLDSTGQESAKTNKGTVYSTVRHTARLSDPDEFMAFVMKHGLFELMDRRANATACRDYADETGELPPGVTINSQRTIGVRAS